MSTHNMWYRVCVCGMVAVVLVASVDIANKKTSEIKNTLEGPSTPASIVELPFNATNGTNEEIFLISNVVFEVGVLEDEGQNSTAANATMDNLLDTMATNATLDNSPHNITANSTFANMLHTIAANDTHSKE